MPELRQLRAFVAVAEELHFTRAAERLHLGQQAVSKSIGQLERELGVALLERTTREVRLTPAGAALLRDGAPDLSVAFHEIRPGEIADALRERTVDLVLARTQRDGPEVEAAALRPSRAELLVPAGHRLAGAPTARLAELDGERLLTWSSPGTPYTDLLLERLRAAGAEVEPVQSRVTGGGEPPDLSETGAVALVPTGWPAGASNVRVPVEDGITLPLLVLWPAGLPSPAVQRLRAGLGTKLSGA